MQYLPTRGAKGINDFSCQSSSNPVILIHGLNANYQTINPLQAFLADKGFCTYSTTYGARPGLPLAGGLTKISDSSKTLRNYVQKVIRKTGKDKVDLVGHSEGGFMSLYLPKAYTEITSRVGRVVAIGPPTHGATVGGLTELGIFTAALLLTLSSLGCESCLELVPKGDAVQFLNRGNITQDGIKYTVIASETDEIVTPAPSASFIREVGVNNVLIQDVCAADKVHHGGEPDDPNVRHIVLNNLQDQPHRLFDCAYNTSSSQ